MTGTTERLEGWSGSGPIGKKGRPPHPSWCRSRG